MQDNPNNTVDPPEQPDETEAAAGQVTTPRRFGIGARTSLLLGMAAVGAVGVLNGWPTVSGP